MIRTAILKAADSIEANPHLFNFESIVNPDESCGTPGCAIGWIGIHCEINEECPADRFEKICELLGFNHSLGMEFYDAMDPLCVGNQWRHDAQICADTLRKYADKYHPADNIPASVRSILEWEEATA